MAKKAIAVPYTEEQNEPSRPLSRIIEVPSNKKERDAMLLELYNSTFQPDEGEEPATVKDGKDDDYGDVIVENDYGCYLFITYIEEQT